MRAEDVTDTLDLALRLGMERRTAHMDHTLGLRS